jgi:hypothetical protein
MGNLVISNWVIFKQLPNYQLTQLPNLFRFFVRRVLAAPLAKLAELQATGRGLLVLGRGVVAFFAFATL